MGLWFTGVGLKWAESQPISCLVLPCYSHFYIHQGTITIRYYNLKPILPSDFLHWPCLTSSLPFPSPPLCIPLLLPLLHLFFLHPQILPRTTHGADMRPRFLWAVTVLIFPLLWIAWQFWGMQSMYLWENLGCSLCDFFLLLLPSHGS